MARTVIAGRGHFPDGNVLPKPEWLEPDGEDKKAALESGREPGLSVWDTAVATPRQAWLHREVPIPAARHRAFAVAVDALLGAASRHARKVEVVADPIEPVPPEWHDGHSLVEGMRKPVGVAKVAHRDFLDDAILVFEEAAV